MNTSNIVIGASKLADTQQATQEALQQALLQQPTAYSWAMVFCGIRHEAHTVIAEIKQSLPNIPVFGGGAFGTITADSLSYQGFECVIALFPQEYALKSYFIQDISENEYQAGVNLGKSLKTVADENDTVLLFYDSIKSSPPPIFHVGSWLLNGIEEGLAETKLNIIGAGLLSDVQLLNSFVFQGEKMAKHYAVALVLPQILKSKTVIMHGCEPISSYMEITKIEGATIYEIDNKPALDTILETLNLQKTEENIKKLTLIVTLGKTEGEMFDEFKEEDYVNRLILFANAADGSVTIFDADFEVGTQIQLMSRSNELMLGSTQRGVKQCYEEFSGTPKLAFYVNCAGRSCGFNGGDEEDGYIIQKELGNKMPILGFYSGVEIAPFRGKSKPLDWTGVLTIFGE